MTNDPALPLYVLDTHALYWYWTDPSRLGPAAGAAFSALEAKQALGVVPLIVIAELHFLSGKLGKSMLVVELFRLVDRASSLRVEALTRRHLLAFDKLGNVPEMHDRLVGAVALVHDAPVISRDKAFRDHPLIRAIW